VRGLIAALLIPGGLLLSARSGPPYSPQDALKTFRLADDFQIELFAAEPLISDPVAMEIDEHGRTYVVEMHGYPLDIGGSGRVVILSDTNADGKPDRSTVFADGLRLPTGIMRWKNGVRSGFRAVAKRRFRGPESRRCGSPTYRQCRKDLTHRSTCSRWRT